MNVSFEASILQLDPNQLPESERLTFMEAQSSASLLISFRYRFFKLLPKAFD